MLSNYLHRISAMLDGVTAFKGRGILFRLVVAAVVSASLFFAGSGMVRILQSKEVNPSQTNKITSQQ